MFAAHDTRSEVLAQTVPRHTSAAFLEFLGEIVTSQPKGREIHVIVDNLATHKTHAVRTFLIAHPTVRLSFTPTYIVAESSRTLVRQDRAGPARARHLYLGR